MSEEDKLKLEEECLLKYSKAQMIEKYIEQFEECEYLSNLWCKSQKEIERLNNIIKEVREYIKENMGYYSERLEYKEYTERYVKDLNKIMNLLDKGE